MTRGAAAAGSALGGLLVALSLPPWGWWPLSFAGIAAFELALGAMPSVRRRAACGWLFAFVWLMVGTAWMWQLSAPGYLVANVVFAGYHAAAATIAPQGRWRLLGRPLAHALAETMRLSFPFGGVPLATLGIAQAAGPFAGLARVGGVILLTWFTFQAGFVVAGAVGAARRADVTPLRHAAVGAAVAVLVLIVSTFVAPRGNGTGVYLSIAAVQGGGEQGTSAADVPSRLVTERHLTATAQIPADTGVDVVLWPENVADVDTFAGSETLAAVAAEAARLGAPIAVGVTEDVVGQPDRFTNAQLTVAPDGTIVSRYDKVRRVPFGEYLPLRGLLEALGAPGIGQLRRDAVAGTDPAVLELPAGDRNEGTRAAVAISWEVFFGGRVRDGVRHGGTVIFNPTNGASYTGTILQTQQVASSRLRAIETGRWLVQASPTGFSEFVTPSGRVIDRTAVSERAVLYHDVELRTGRTWYVALADWPWISALLAVLAGLMAAARRPSFSRRLARSAP